MAGKPVRQAKKNKRPSARLVIALPLMPAHSGPHESLSNSEGGAGLATISSRPQTGHNAKPPAFPSGVSNFFPHRHVTEMDTGRLQSSPRENP